MSFFKTTLRFCPFFCVVPFLVADTIPLHADMPTPVWPDTLAAKRAKQFFEAVHAADDGPMREFESANRSPESLRETPLEQRVAKARSIREQVGGLEIGKVEADGDFKIDVVARAARLGVWLRFRLIFSPEAPHYLQSIQGTPTGPPDQAPIRLNPSMTLPEMLDEARRQSGVPAVAVAVVRNGQVEESAVTGVRCADGSDAAGSNDRFHVGSVGKAMTATLIGKLVEQGVLNWDTTVGSVLADVAMRPEYAGVTLEQLLQHRGGIRSYTEDLAEEGSKRLVAAGDPTQQRLAFARQLLNEPPVTAPGTVMAYSNAGYSLAALMAERRSGRSWELLMGEHVFGPLGMTGASFGWPLTAERRNQPCGHFDAPPRLRVQKPGEYELGDFLAPAGDIHCTIGDLARFAISHLEGLRGKDGVVKAETVRRLHRPPVSERPAYACGWTVEALPGGRSKHWHEGSGGTFYAAMMVLPEDDFAVVALANAAMPAKPCLDAILVEIYRKFEIVVP
jgi:CubicO group peptidase (beta-lactamase class C family)